MSSIDHARVCVLRWVGVCYCVCEEERRKERVTNRLSQIKFLCTNMCVKEIATCLHMMGAMSEPRPQDGAGGGSGHNSEWSHFSQGR